MLSENLPEPGTLPAVALDEARELISHIQNEGPDDEQNVSVGVFPAVSMEELEERYNERLSDLIDPLRRTLRGWKVFCIDKNDHYRLEVKPNAQEVLKMETEIRQQLHMLLDGHIDQVAELIQVIEDSKRWDPYVFKEPPHELEQQTGFADALADYYVLKNLVLDVSDHHCDELGMAYLRYLFQDIHIHRDWNPDQEREDRIENDLVALFPNIEQVYVFNVHMRVMVERLIIQKLMSKYQQTSPAKSPCDYQSR